MGKTLKGLIDSQTFPIVNDLTTGGEESALSAEQGKILDEMIEAFETTNYVSSTALTNTGFVRPAGTISTSSGYRYTDKIDISGASLLKIYSKPYNASVATVVFYDSSETYISGAAPTNPTSLENRIVTVPTNAKYAVFSTYNDSSLSSFAVYRRLSKFDELESQITAINTRIDATNAYVAEVEELTTKEIKDYIVATDFVNIGFLRPTGVVDTSGSYRYTNKINVVGCMNLKIHDTSNIGSVSPAVFYDSNNEYISGYTWSEGNDFTIPVPTNAVSVVCSIKYTEIGNYSCKADKYMRYINEKNNVCYLSNSGSDTNDGLTAAKAVKTLAKVKELLNSDGTLYILEGDYEMNLDLSLFSNVIGVGNVRILKYGQKIDSALLVSGYTKVYSIAYTGDLASQGNLYAKHLWQHDIPDVDTLIASDEVHPLQFGKTYRVPSTRIYPAESIAAIESGTKPMWFYDNSTQTLYFSIVEGSNLATNPVIVPTHNNGTGASKKKDVNIENINFLYHAVGTHNLTGTFKQCSVSFTSNAGAWVLDLTSLITLINCEACAGDNDGFNTQHNSTSELPISKIIFENCWGHDCADDGESCHGYSVVIHHGGLFEYNGNGVTPASGGKGEYYDVMVRNCTDHDWVTDNGGTGFSAQYASGSHSVVVCHNCIALNNKVGFSASSANDGSIAINCVTKGNSIIAFRNITQLNCSELS